MLKMIFGKNEDAIDPKTLAEIEMANMTLRGRMEKILEQDTLRKLRCETIQIRTHTYYNK